MTHTLPLGATPHTDPSLSLVPSPAMTSKAACEDAIDGVEVAADALGWAMRREMELEDQRSLLKPFAVRRIMEQFNLAATPAEKIVEQDAEYMAHRKSQYEAVVDVQSARGCYEAAKLRAQMNVALVVTALSAGEK